METALIITGSDKATESLSSFLKMAGCLNIGCVSSGSEARRIIVDREYDLVIINTPLSDEFGAELSVNICEKSTAGVILIVRAENAEEIASKVEDSGVFVLAKPFAKQMFFQAVRLLSVAKNRMYSLQNQNKKLLKKIEDIRLVDRAKCVLIANMAMTEQQAHRYIEKQSMDMRISKKEVAEGILKTYEY